MSNKTSCIGFFGKLKNKIFHGFLGRTPICNSLSPSPSILNSYLYCYNTSLKFIQLVESRELRRSMFRRGNCWDNAPQESFFGHMEDDLAGEMPGWTSFAEAKASVDCWIEYYNHDRCQWDLGKLSPNEYYCYITTGEYPNGMLPPWVK